MVDRYSKNAGAVFTLKYHLAWCPKYRMKRSQKMQGSAVVEFWVKSMLAAD